jgi:hypothetical protein
MAAISKLEELVDDRKLQLKFTFATDSFKRELPVVGLKKAGTVC